MKRIRSFFRLTMSSLAVACLVFITTNTQIMAAGSTENTSIVPVISLLLGEDPIDQTLPVANAGTDFKVLVGELVQLDGSASSEPTMLPLSYLWSFSSRPPGSAATLSDATLVNPSFVLDLPGSYVIELVVNNGIKDSQPDTILISNTNRLPIADAGVNSVAPLSQAVQLNGSNSSDIDGDPLTYLWSITEKPATSVASLMNVSAETPELTPDVKGNYVLSLVVNDGFLDSDADSVEVLAGVSLSIGIDDAFFGVGRNTTATISLNLPAPPQGVVISLSVDDPIIGLSKTQLSFAQGETEKTLTLSGLGIGITNLNASGTNIEEVSVAIEVSGALISIGEIAPLSPSGSVSAAISLSDAAPLGGVSIDLETLNNSIATVSPASLFIPEGQFTPVLNAQITGVSLGNTALRATGPGFAPDERAIQVALSAAFDSSALNVPETLSRDIVLTLDAPAPTGGVTFNLSIIGASLFGVQATVRIEEGQTQSLPITLAGLAEGIATLRASADSFIDTDAIITVIDAPNVFLKANGPNFHLSEANIGVGLQRRFGVRLEVTPTTAVDIRASVPQNSGVLLSSSSNTVGSETVVFEDIISTSSPIFSIQGVSLGDDVPITIEVFKANTNTLAGYEALPSTVDIDPSGVYLASVDFSTTTFTTNRQVKVISGMLYDDEHGPLDGAFRQAQFPRPGDPLLVGMQVDDDSLLTLPDGATGTLTINPNSISGTIAVTPMANGLATVSIASQPEDFSLPSNRSDSVAITIVTPKAFVRSAGSSSHLAEAIVGRDLQRLSYVRLEVAPPNPVDIMVSVPASSGVLLSTQPTSAGSTQILLEDVSTTRSPAYYIQGTALGDDVPITVTVYNANTSDLAGYNSLASTVDVDPSGLYVITSDYSTTSFSSNRSVAVSATLLYDAETPAREGESLTPQAVRGGLDLIVPMQVNNVAVASLPAGATDNLTLIAGSTHAGISVDPISAGLATISIASLPGAFIIPSNRDDNTLVTVSAANAFFRSAASASHQAEAIVGIDLQSAHHIGLAVTPPSAVDIRVSVPAASGVLLSTDGALSGTNSLLFEDITSSRSPQFYAQGTALGDDVAVTIEVLEANTLNPIGYNVLASTIDVDPSGVYMSTGDYTTNTFAANRNLSVFTALLYDNEDAVRDGRRRVEQATRGGLSLSVPMVIDDNTVAVLPGGSTGTLSIPTGNNRGTIALDPLTAGVATVEITAQPNPNFTLPSDRDGEVTVTVTAPDARFNVASAHVGDELQAPIIVYLAEAPPNPVDVTVDIISPAVALISKDSATAGSASVTFSNISATQVGTIYVQGLALNSATQIKVSAPGYNDDTANIEVVPSGFRLIGNFSSNISTGSTRNFTITSARLNANGTFSVSQAVRGGANFNIVTSSSLPGVGTVASPVILNGGDGFKATTFTAVSPGTTTIQITQPAGFTPPVGATDGDITVE